MKAKAALVVAALQVLVLAFMAGQREWISSMGTPLTLRTAPIDPDDPMRGAYVRLDYEISQIPPALCHGATAEWVKTTDYYEQRNLRDRAVFAALRVNEHGIAELTSVSDAPPESGPFLRGRVEHVDVQGLRVRYGIEALFMQQDAAQAMESMAIREKAGAPINAHIAVGASGTAVLKDYSWEPLGLTIVLDPTPAVDARPQEERWRPQPTTGLTVTLHNYSDDDLAIVNLPGAHSFRMVPNLRANTGHYVWVGETLTERPTPKPEDIVVLKPGTKHSVHLDLTQPAWWVVDARTPGSKPIPLQQVAEGWSASFRIEYSPPSPDATRALPHAELIRHAPLRSRAFNASRGMD